MKDVNKVILMGRLGADPIQRETKNGMPVVNFSIATSQKYYERGQGQSGELKETTQWHRVVAWEKLGENCVRFLKKGSPVYVEGMIRSRTYTAKDGGPRNAFEVHAHDVIFLPWQTGAGTISASSDVPESFGATSQVAADSELPADAVSA